MNANGCGLSFGWVDGISQPIVKGLDDLSKKSNDKGMTPIDPGYVTIVYLGCIVCQT